LSNSNISVKDADANNKEIFEGDIIRYYLKMGGNYVLQSRPAWVRYSDVTASYILHTKSLIELSTVVKPEIIGNFHEHSNLLHP
jgi:hypothetical protein